VEQQIRFCTAPDGAQLAYAVHGSGPPIVRAATWLTHLEYDWESPVWRHWLEQLGQGHTLIRYDERGCGLSDHELGELSMDTWVSDLETVVTAAGLDRFSLLGVSQGAPVALVYAARHPERLTHLVIYGGYARGRKFRDPGGRRQEDALLSAIRAGWEDPDPTFRHLFSMMLLPHGSPRQLAWYDDLQQRSTSSEIAVRLYAAHGSVDVTEFAPQVTTKTLIVHARGDRAVPLEEGRLLGTLIPDARLALVDSANHILLSDEPAWAGFLEEVHAFLGTKREPEIPAVGTLTPRELEVLELVAAGLTNEAIAERLCLSVRTVERHLSNLYGKLGVSGKAGRAAAAATFSQIGEPPSSPLG
jgi:pimeloyl-ACP methyl ester carboxylesterase/DNA-binding CsgD family transcriptional regulator